MLRSLLHANTPVALARRWSCRVLSPLSHAGILDPDRTPRRPGETSLARLAGRVSALGPMLLIALGFVLFLIAVGVLVF